MKSAVTYTSLLEYRNACFEKLTNQSHHHATLILDRYARWNDDLESYFKPFRENIIGIDQRIQTPHHKSVKLLYADWTASGRLYSKIEDKLRTELYPIVANTHTDTNHTGMTMTYAYHKAQKILKAHVGASANDVIICCGSGMTGVVNKFQRIL